MYVNLLRVLYSQKILFNKKATNISRKSSKNIKKLNKPMIDYKEHEHDNNFSLLKSIHF